MIMQEYASRWESKKKAYSCYKKGGDRSNVLPLTVNLICSCTSLFKTPGGQISLRMNLGIYIIKLPRVTNDN